MSDKKDNKFGFSEGTAVDLDGGAISEAHEKSAPADQGQSTAPPEQLEANSPETSDNEVIAATMAMDSELIANQLQDPTPALPGHADESDPSQSGELPIAPELFDDDEPQKTMAMEMPQLSEDSEDAVDEPPTLPSFEEDDGIEKTMAMDTPDFQSDDGDGEEIEKTAAMELGDLNFPDDDEDHEAPNTLAMDPEGLSFPADEDNEDSDEDEFSPRTLAMEPPQIDSPPTEDETNSRSATTEDSPVLDNPNSEVPLTSQNVEQEKPANIPMENLKAEVTAAIEEGFPGDRTMMFDASALLEAREEQGPQGVLTVIYGADKDNEYYLQGESTMVGRGLDCDVVVNDRSVSRKHFRIDRRGGEFYLVDLGSGNGTKVNDERVSDVALVNDTQIEAGTTIMTFGYVGSDQRAPADVQYAVRAVGGRLKVAFGLLAVTIVSVGTFLLGETMGWWAVVREPVAITKTIIKPPPSQGQRYLAKAHEHLADKALNDAMVALENAESAQANNILVKRLNDRINNARRHKKQIALQKSALKRGEYQGVLRDLETIPTTSPFFTDADELRDRATHKLVEKWKDKAYKLQDAGKDKEAIALLKQVLKENPNDAEAAAVIEELGGGKDIAAAKPKPDTKAKADTKADTKAKPKPDTKARAKAKLKKAAKKKAGKAVSKANKTPKTVRTKSLTISNVGSNTGSNSAKSASVRGNLRRGYKLYSSGQFSDATDYLDELAQNSRVRKSDRKKARILADQIVAFASTYRKAKSAVANFKPSSAIPLLEKSRTLDKRITGVFGGEIRRQLAKMYAFKAAGAYSSQKFKEAARMAAKAVKLNPGESSARLVQSRVNDKVSSLMSQARAANSQSNFARAKKLYKQLLGILPSNDKRYTEASRALRNIIAGQADDEDD